LFLVPHKKSLLLLILLSLLVTAACSGEQTTHELAPVSMLPDYVQTAPPTVREAYRFAVANPDVLAHQPCYCGCGTMGHTSNLSCYVSDVAEDGTVTFDNHAAGCGICVDITQDVMRLMVGGQSQLEIRHYIDAQYSPFGPSTDTPLPQS